jgi:folate-binding protein YgfZ
MTSSSAASTRVPTTGEIAGQAIVLHYGDVAGEYAALRSGAIAIDRSARGRMRVTGPRAREMITGMVTNDVQALNPGYGLYAAALTPKGKIVSDLRIFATDDALLIDAPARAYAGWQAMVRKYVNPRLAPYTDESGITRDLGIFGPRAPAIVSALTGLDTESLTALPPYGHRAVARDGAAWLVARVPELDVHGYELFIPAAAFDAAWHAALAAGATASGLAAWDIARVEAGRPEWGVDIDDTTIPQEANFDELHAISYTKGCYIGQEVVARVHFRGHVNRHLRGLRAAGTAPLPEHAVLTDATGKPVGDVRSSVLSPRLGPIALAMVRREVNPGATVTAQWEDGEARAEVVTLPFSPL